MKKTIICYLFLLFSFTLNAQVENSYVKMPKQKKLGISEWTCVFQHVVADPNSKSIRTYQQILQTSTKISIYKDYCYFRIDSVFSDRDRNKITQKDYDNYSKLYGANKSFVTIIKKSEDNELAYRSNIFSDFYVYYEKMPEFNWSISKDTMTVCGYVCHKAISSFRGRTWIAWFSKDINISDGPWKFHGLPGLILSVESEDKEISFKAVTIIKRATEILQNITNNDYTTTRERFLKLKYNYKTRPKQFMNGIVDLQNSEMPNNSMFYNPIEIDVVTSEKL